MKKWFSLDPIYVGILSVWLVGSDSLRRSWSWSSSKWPLTVAALQSVSRNRRLVLTSWKHDLVTRVKHRGMSSPWKIDSRPRDPTTDPARIARGPYTLGTLARTLCPRIRPSPMMRTWHHHIRPLIIRYARSYICIVILDIIHLVPHVHVIIWI
jgi:hypothetical protein